MQFKRILNTLRIATATSMCILTAGLAQAQAFPNRPITFIYPYAAGSTADTGWRTVVQEASKRIGQTMVFENRPGAGGRLGLDAMMRAAPDGYTLAGAPNAVIVVQALVEPRLYIEPGKHYTPIVNVLETYLLLAARANAPFRDLKSLIAYAKSNPGKLNGASSGAGTTSHLGLAMLGTKAGIDYTHVHYKGLAPALTALLANEVDFTFSDPGAKPYIESGRMHGIAVTGTQRWPLFSTLPTMQEAGLSEFNVAPWHAVVAPPGLPQDVTAAINRAFNQALSSPDLRAKLEAVGWVIKGGSSADLAALIRHDLDVYRPIVRAANIKLD